MNEGERNTSIAYILDCGLVKPMRVTGHLRSLYRQFGLYYLFWDTAQMIALIVVTLIGVLMLLPNAPEIMKYSLLFACSPLIFLLSMICSDVAERVGGIYELKMTCKYNMRQINVFRIICFALIGVVFSVASGCVIGICNKAAPPSDERAVLDLLSLSLAALFLCAFIFLALTRRFPGRLSSVVGAAIWLVLGVVPMAIFGTAWEVFLIRIPAALTIAVAIISAVLFGYELANLLKNNQLEEFSYAVR
jgi:hypothetical protein